MNCLQNEVLATRTVVAKRFCSPLICTLPLTYVNFIFIRISTAAEVNDASGTSYTNEATPSKALLLELNSKQSVDALFTTGVVTRAKVRARAKTKENTIVLYPKKN